MSDSQNVKLVGGSCARLSQP